MLRFFMPKNDPKSRKPRKNQDSWFFSRKIQKSLESLQCYTNDKRSYNICKILNYEIYQLLSYFNRKTKFRN